MNLEEIQSASSSKLIAFDRADVIPGIAPGTWYLHVSGEAPCLNMEVRLSPLIYVMCPEYWGIEVTGSLKGFCLTAMKPHSLVLPLTGITGSTGIEVIGGNRRQKFEVSGGCGGDDQPR